MILYFLVALSLGVEGGYNLPVGFDNLESGPGFAVFVSRDFGITNIALSLETNFYRGKNSAYSLNSYGFRLGFNKSNWLFSPAIDLGADYINRKINAAKETGYAVMYGLGFLINFHVEQLRISPKFYYSGLTDFKSHAGFIGLRIGISYEI